MTHIKASLWTGVSSLRLEIEDNRYLSGVIFINTEQNVSTAPGSLFNPF